MSSNLSPLEMLTAIISNEKDYLEPDELAQTIIDAGFISIYGNVPKQIAEHLAHEMECTISTGDVAEVSAYVEGETGRAGAVNARDSLYEEPNEWVRSYAKLLGGETWEYSAQALRDGKWEPLDQEATKELRERIEHG